MTLFPQNSNLYDHDTSTSQTDGQTDGRSTCHGNTALRIASRGKNATCSDYFSTRCRPYPITAYFLLRVGTMTNKRLTYLQRVGGVYVATRSGKCPMKSAVTWIVLVALSTKTPESKVLWKAVVNFSLILIYSMKGSMRIETNSSRKRVKQSKKNVKSHVFWI